MSLTLAMDILIVVLLAATIFYAVRLSKHLDAFRSNRSDMERLIRDLSMQITRAQEGISTLDELAKESSDELRALVAKSTGLSDELQLITESGDNLAERLEKLATKNRELVDQIDAKALDLVYPGGRPEAKPLSARRNEEMAPPSRLFAIRDPDFSADDAEMDDDIDDGEDAADDDVSYQSKSERDLAAALRRRKENM